jgi:hypothetical protein
MCLNFKEAFMKYLVGALRTGLCAAFIALLAATGSAAPAPVGYHGHLSHLSGAVFHGTVNVTVRIHPGEDSTAELWHRAYGGVAVNHGLLSLLLEDLPGQSLDTALAASDDLWLSFEVNGAQMQGRQRLVSVGFSRYSAHALEAENASSLGGVDAGNYLVQGSVPAPVSPSDAATKEYVDALIAQGGGGGGGFSDYVLLTDKRPSGTASQGIAQSTWVTKELNTLEQDEAGVASLAGNVITLAAGSYSFRFNFLRPDIPSVYDTWLLRLVENSTGVAFFTKGDASGVGSTQWYSNDVSWNFRRQVVEGRFTLVSETAIRLQLFHLAGGTVPLGLPRSAVDTASALPVQEHYATLELWRHGGGGNCASPPPTPSASPAHVRVEDRKPAGSVSQTIAAQTWTARQLTAEVIDTDGIATLVNNRVTVPAGRYRVRAWSWLSGWDGSLGQGTRLRLVDATSQQSLALGRIYGGEFINSQYSTGGGNHQKIQLEEQEIVLHSNTTLELQMRSSRACGTGTGDSWDDHEIFGALELWKL